LAWLTLSDPFVRIAFWIGTGAFAATLLLGAQIVTLRVLLRRRERGTQATIAKWRPILNAALAGIPATSLPVLARREEIDFLKLWLHLYTSLRGDSRAALDAIATELHCARISHRLLASGNRAQQLVGILVLGHLKDKSAYDRLQRSANDPARLVSRHATWALVQIDPVQAAQRMAPYMVTNPDWAVREIVTALQQARAECEPVLLSMIAQVAPQGEVPAAARQFLPHLPRLLQVIEGLRITPPSALMVRLLRDASSDVLIPALRLVADPALRDAVQPHLQHTDWRVRLQAARTFGRIGMRDDLPAMSSLLTDSQWWVRYRTAQAIAALPFLGRGELQRMADEAGDRYASDILRQVIAEGTPG
jgi:hypothetical protein